MKSFVLSSFILAIILGLSSWNSFSYAEEKLVVVVNSASGIDKLSREEVINIFLGRYRKLPSGITAQPIDQPINREDKALFYKLLVGKELSEINSYWARLFFSGKTVQPKQAHNIPELLELVGTLPGAVTYLRADQIDPRFKIVFNLY